MKNLKFSVITLFVLITCNCYSQKEIIGPKFGIKAGINVANVTIKSGGLSISPNSIIGATGGFFATFPNGPKSLVQIELLYSTLGFKLTSGSTSITENINYLVLPVLAKYTFEHSGFSAYIGPQVGFLLSAKTKNGAVSFDDKDSWKSVDIAGIIGADYTFPAGFNLSGRYQLGLANTAKNSGSGESAKNNALTFTVGYRFQ